MKTFLFILLFLAVAGAAVVAYAAMQPDQFRIERSKVVGAPADRIFPLISDFKAWGHWSPWEHKDPDMKRTYSEPAAGQGARYSWKGNGEVGKGEIVMAEVQSPSRVKLDMHFKAPFEARHVGLFTLVPEADGTRVTWAMEGSSPLFAKVLHLVMNMDKMVGGEFEKGLEAMKAKAEKG